MASPLPLLLALALGAEARLDTGVRTEARARWVDPPADPGGAQSLDLAVSPTLRLSLTELPARLELGYTPLFTARDVGPDQRFDALHQGEVRLSFAPRAPWSASAFAAGSRGRTDLVSASLDAEQPPLPTVPTVSYLETESLRAGLELRLAPDRRSEILLAASALVSGGADDASRKSLPTARGVAGRLELGRSLSRRDRLSLSASAETNRVDALRSDSAVIEGLLSWRRSATARTQVVLGAGAVGFHDSVRADDASERETQRSVRPAAALAIERDGGPAALSGSLAARLSATNDRVTGRASPSLEGTLLARWPVTERWLLYGSGTGSMTWPEGGRTRRLGATVGGARRLAEWAALDLSAYGTWQRVGGDAAAPAFTEYGGRLALELTAPPLVRRRR